MGAGHLLVRLRAWLRRRKVREEIRDEFEFHIEQRTVDNVLRGLTPEEARRAAERTFGRRAQLMEAAYGEHRGGRSVAFPTYVDLAQAATGELDLAAYAQRPLSIRFGDGDAERVAAEIVTDNYFPMLRVAAIAGRFWSTPSAPRSVVPLVLSEAFARRMTSSVSLIGSDVWINGEPGVVVGIAPDTFAGSSPGFRASAWVPIEALPALRARLTDRGDRWLNMIGRLAPGVPTTRAQARLTTMTAAQPRAREDAIRVEPAAGLAVSPDSRTPFLASLGALAAVMVVVLLVASASVGGLLLARSIAARRETALRLALGASRFRIAQQILCETLLLALLA